MTFPQEALDQSSRPTAAAGSAGPLFELAGVSYAVAGRTLLQPLDLSLGDGRLIGLIGHNGSGKSTLMKLLSRQQPPTSGRLSFEGKPLERWDDRAFARRVAYLPQQTPPAAGMLAHELVALGRYPWHGALGRFGPADRRKVEEAIELTDIGRFGDRLVETLSGGEHQRVWLAMLIAQDTRCLLLDEPTSSLDVAHQIEVLSLIRRLSRQKGLSVVVVLHDINMAARFCDEILALHGGRMIAHSTPAELMRPDRLAEVYGIPMGVLMPPDGEAAIAYAR
jgi:iron complex transport system ATP-binding protein